MCSYYGFPLFHPAPSRLHQRRHEYCINGAAPCPHPPRSITWTTNMSVVVDSLIILKVLVLFPPCCIWPSGFFFFTLPIVQIGRAVAIFRKRYHMGKGGPLQLQLPALHGLNPDSGGLFLALSGCRPVQPLLFPLFVLQDDL